MKRSAGPENGSFGWCKHPLGPFPFPAFGEIPTPVRTYTQPLYPPNLAPSRVIMYGRLKYIRGTPTMADEVLQKATQRRDELAAKINAAQQQIEEWKRDLGRADAFIAAWYEYAGTEPPALVQVRIGGLSMRAETGHYTISGGDAPKKPTGNSKKEDVAAEVRRVIEERGAPVLRKDLMPVLLERGYKIEGSDPDMVLSTMLWRAGDAAGVVRLKKGGYWLKERPWDEAEYVPGLDMFEGAEDDAPLQSDGADDSEGE